MRNAAVTFYQFVTYAIIKRHQNRFKFDTCKLEQSKDNSDRHYEQKPTLQKDSKSVHFDCDKCRIFWKVK